jgi:hypothetical protein
VSPEKDLEEQGYRAYMLRLWRAREDEQRVWRFSLEDPTTGRRKGFADLDELMLHLLKTIGNQDEADAL